MDSTLLSNTTTDSNLMLLSNSFKSKLVLDIVHICREFLVETGPTRDAAALCLASLLTLPDMEAIVLADFMEWSYNFIYSWANNENVCNELSATLFRLIGILQTTGQIFKRGHRNNLLPFVNTMITPCLRLFFGCLFL